jgi:hypothetical protein
MTNAGIFGLAAGFSPRNGNTTSQGLPPRVVAIAAAAFLLASTAAAQKMLDIKPGDTCEKLRASYGKELSVEGPAHVWQQGEVNIRVLVKPNGPCVAGSVQYSIDAAHTVATRDGIIVGKDNVASASLKLKGRINSTSFYFVRGEGKAYAMLEVPPTPAFPFKSTYGWVLNPAVANKLKDMPQLTDFTTEPVTFYSLDNPDPQGMQ